MLAEQMVRTGLRLVDEYAPDGKDYWAARFWDRDKAESDPVLGHHYRDQKRALGDVIERYGAGADRVLEFACGTGEFTKIAADRTDAADITALDISAQGLERTRQRVNHPGLRLVQGDFWDDHALEPAPLVVCIDAIHHLGTLRSVLTRLRSFVQPGGVLVGNVWTIDHFHEFQRQRYGTAVHTARAAMFLGTAMMIRASNGRIRTASYRTQLRSSGEIPSLLGEVFGEILDIIPDRFFIGFACRP